MNVRIREATGRGSSRRLRKGGEIPAVVYGPSGSQTLAVSESAFNAAYRKMAGGTFLVEIVDDKGGTRLTQIKDTQQDPIRDEILHIDFSEVVQGQEMTASVPIHVLGEAVGVRRDGGVLEVIIHEVDVSCMPQFLPSHLEVDVSALEIGDSIHVSDLNLPEGVTVDAEGDAVVLAIAAPIKEEEVEPAEETVAPDAVPTTAESREKGDEEEGKPDQD